mgnify:CR=1 FL=1
MKKLLRFAGLVAFWLGWPVLWVYLRGKARTRVIVECQGKILVVRSLLGTGKWQLPGGGLHRGEEPSVGAARELLEETGLSVRASELVPLNEVKTAKHTTIYGLTFLYYGFVVRIEQLPALRMQTLEITDIGWMDPADMHAGNTSKDVLAMLSTWQRTR